MNALIVQNPCHKYDFGNKKIIAAWDNSNNYYTEIILYMCVCV